MVPQSFKNRSSLVIAIWVLLLTPPLCRAEEAETTRLIQAYVSAAQGNDLEMLRNAWTDLNNNKEAVQSLQKNQPQLYYLFQVRGLYFQVDDLEKKALKTLADQSPLPPAEEAAQTAPPGAEEVKNFSVSEPQPNPLPTNREIVERSKNGVIRDNRDIAIDNPNQNRQDNKTLIDNRTEAMFEQKFQKAPDVLVPRGDDEGPALPSTKP